MGVVLSIESMRVFLHVDAILAVSTCILSTGLWQLFSVSVTVVFPFLCHKYMASSFSKRQSVYNFNEERKDQYLFVNIKGTPICLLCSAKVAILKKHNVECHFNSLHCSLNDNLPLRSEL